MDNQRLLTWGLFIMLAWFTYQTWQMDYNQPPPEPEAMAVQPADDAPPSTGELPSVDSATLPQAGGTQPVADAVDNGQPVTVTTDVYRIRLSTRGAAIISAEMLRYPISKKNPDDKISLLATDGDNYARLKLGLRGDGAPAADVLMTTPSMNYELGNAAELRVPFTWQNDDGLVVTRTYIFTPGSYRIDVEQTIDNNSDRAWTGDQYIQLIRHSTENERSMFDPDSYSFDGAVSYNGEDFEKYSFKDLNKDSVSYNATGGWLGSIRHHFLTVIHPPADLPHAFQVTQKGNRMTASVVSARRTVEAGTSQTFQTSLFVGPKLQDQLEALDPKLKLTVDYGILTMLSQPMFWLLSMVHDYTGNWGVAIIIVTLLIKLVFYKLTESSGRSMAKMRELQPRMKALQDRYKDDRQALSQAMMDLYKREKVNPAAGCLPILVQMPFFLSFYWVLIESVEMRQAPFALWLTDLSTRDPYFILPVIMGAAMLMQQRLNPAPADPVQARVMQIMPIVFTGFFAFFPSGLVLYWVTNTVLSIAQQWKINRVVAREARDKKAARGGKKGDKPSN